MGEISKSEKLQKVVESHLLDERRFVYSKDPEVRKQLSLLFESIKELKTHHPEIIAFMLYGSRVKGYATQESDTDGVLLVDYEIAKKDLGEDANNNLSGNELKNRIRMKYKEILSNKLAEKKLLGSSKNLIAEPVDKTKIMEALKGNEEYLLDRSYCITQLFYFPVGRLPAVQGQTHLNDYRRMVLDELEKQGDKGECKWQKIMKEVGYWEALWIGDEELLGPSTAPERHKRIYPQTIKEARNYFLNSER
jgi:predicted nucleotidyltransferase